MTPTQYFSNSPKPEAVIINVDDHEPARYARSRILRSAGFEVHDAGTGEEGLRLAAERRPDIVLLDVHLPDMSGLDVCQRIKRNRDMGSVIVLQISASAISAPQATAALRIGADSYLVEPVDPDVLIATVRAFLRLRLAERELAKTNESLRQTNEQLQQLNKELKRSNEDLENFASVASHDLLEPLRTISSQLQLLSRLKHDDWNKEEAVHVRLVVDAANRMRSLIIALLDYSRLGREARAFQELDLGSSARWAVENLTNEIQESGATVRLGDLPVVWGDALQLSRVFQNLLGNALKYRSDSQPLVVTIDAEREASGEWVISVRDNGIGVERKYHELIFQPFKRLHSTDVPGTGIGLALCRRIIEAHGGRIWIDSERGEGTSVRFTLPAVSGTRKPD